MKKRMSYFFLFATVMTLPLMANTIDVSPTGQVYRDRYGAEFKVPSAKQLNRRPTKQELGIDTDHIVDFTKMIPRK